MVYAEVGAPDKAGQVAMEAVDIAHTTASARTFTQLRRLHARLTRRWPAHPVVATFGDALR